MFCPSRNKASSHIMWLCSPVCVRPGRKPRRPVFSQRGSLNGEKVVITTENLSLSGLLVELYDNRDAHTMTSLKCVLNRMEDVPALEM